MELSILDLAAAFLTLAALIGWLNLRTLRAPPSVAMLAVALILATAIPTLDGFVPVLGLKRHLAGLLQQVDFSAAVLRFMLAYLLFAGAMHVDVDALRRRAWTAAVLASLGVLVSAAVVGGGLWLAAKALGVGLTWPWAVAFGVLISPTDPVGVLAILKRTSLVADIRALIEGEALFNDGVGVVLFGAAVAAATGGGHAAPVTLITAVAQQAFGGAVLGLLAGLATTWAMRQIDDFAIEVGLTLALATGVYALADHVGVSGPIGVVVAGLLVGRHSNGERISETTRRSLQAFWIIIDENLNGALFLLLGLEVMALQLAPSALTLVFLAAPLTVAARWVALAGPTAVLKFIDPGLRPGLSFVMTWAGVRGGLSVAMALSMPPTPSRTVILTITYGVVICSVIIQSLTLERLVLALGYGRRSSSGD